MNDSYFKLLANASYEGVFIHDHGILLYANERFFRLFQYEEEELINKQVIPLLLTPDSLPITEQHVSDKSIEIYEVECVKKDGTIFSAEALPRNEVLDGKPVRVIAIRDITEYKKQQKILQESKEYSEKILKESEEYFKLLANASFEGILIHDQGVAINVNARFEEMYGYTREELIGKNLIPIAIAPDSMENAINHVRLNMLEPYEINCRKKDGTIFPVELRPSQAEYNGKIVRVIALRDMTKIKAYQKSLLEAKEMAEQANIAKSQFLSKMSHEFRTPLNAIFGFAQLLEMDADKLGKNQFSYVEEIIAGARHLMSLIDDLLDLDKIESGALKLNMEKVDLDEVLEASLALVLPQANNRQIEINDRISGSRHCVYADSVRLKQIILNLLSNAVKYNREPGRITLDSEIVDERQLRISVTDSGNGLSANELKKLFTPFERLNVTSDIEGTGIGLVIVKHLAELMGGTAGASSVKGEGSTFWIEVGLFNRQKWKPGSARSDNQNQDVSLRHT